LSTLPLVGCFQVNGLLLYMMNGKIGIGDGKIIITFNTQDGR
jgi:hypothetical protein